MGLLTAADICLLPTISDVTSMRCMQKFAAYNWVGHVTVVLRGFQWLHL